MRTVSFLCIVANEIACTVSDPHQGRLRLQTTLNSSQLFAAGNEGQSATSMTSYQSVFDEQKRPQELVAEVESLRQKLSSVHKRDIELDDVRKERLFLREAVNTKQQHVETLMKRLAKAQMTEKALNHDLDAFEARLEMVNAQKNDVLEENHELRQTALRRLKQEEKDRNHYITRLEQELRQCRFQIDNKHLPPSLQPTSAARSRRSDSVNQGGSQDLATLRAQVAQLSQTLGERDASINSLQAERDKITALLHSEIRAHARKGPEQIHPANSALSGKMDIAQTMADVREKARSSVAPADTKEEAATDPLQRIEQLEREIDYHVKDIVLYKLDVKGYKKDIRTANVKIQRLQGSSTKSSPAPSSISSSHRTSSSAPISASSQTQPLPDWPEPLTVTGLGILTPESNKPHPPRKDSLPPSTHVKRDSSSNISLGRPQLSDSVLYRTPSASPSRSQPRTPTTSSKRLPRTPLTPPATNSPSGVRYGENVPVAAVATATASKSIQTPKSPKPSLRTTTSATPVSADQKAVQVVGTSGTQRLDRSLSESVVEALSGSPQSKASLSLYPHASISHATGPLLVGGKKSFQKLTGRRSKSANVALPTLLALEKGKGEGRPNDGEKIDSGVDVRA
ncbi:MAG: hypothetical protein M1822_004557 [Bathelium mastoideum]|nr:MAG: hypothetical protein M1822_004557 [Bathelium mastoideum]